MDSSSAQVITANAQVNARISPSLKQAGDTGLAAAGITPTQAVRALWELAASYAESPEKLIAALFPQRVALEEEKQAQERRQRAQTIEEGSHIVENAYQAMGLTWPPASAALSYDELRDIAYEEEYGNLMGWA